MARTPTHGRVDIGPKDEFPKFPANSPFAAYDKQPVNGIAVTSTPTKGFSDAEVFSFVDNAA
ncbi:MAG TPA: hypothetical protein VGM42_14525, partial [Rhodopila sp.]